MRVLIVDDDPFILQTLQAVLEAEGHSVTACNGGREGIEAFKLAHVELAPYALVITDAAMPVIDGHQVLKAVKENSSSTPVILFAGSPQYPSRGSRILSA